MKPFLLRLTLCCRLLLAASLLSSATAWAGDSGSEADANEAKNLARMNCGAQIERIGADGQVAEFASTATEKNDAATLILDDNTMSCPLPEGRTTFLIKLPATSLLDRFTFINEDAAAVGEVKISVSNFRLPVASEKWLPVDGRVGFSHKRLFKLSMLGVEARYVKLEFEVQKAGRIAALGLYGGQGLASFSKRNLPMVHDGIGGRDLNDGVILASNKSTRAALEDSVNFNFANVYAHARIVYVSSGYKPAARRMIDDDTMTTFKFAPDDQHPLVIVELAEAERLHRVSALYTMRSGKLDLYLLDKLNSDPADLSEAKLIATTTDTKRAGKAALEFDPQGARYVALRWTPESDDPGEPFEVAEINAFGSVPLAMLDFNAVPNTFADLTTTGAPSLPSAVPTLPGLPLVSP